VTDRDPYAAADTRLNRQGLARWRSGHPWIYRAGVAEVVEETGREALTRVRDPRGRVLGRALLSRESQITLRILTRSDEPVDRDFWRRRLQRAFEYRDRLLPGRDAVRLVFGESDGLPGLVVDRYGPHLVLQSLAWGIDAFQDQIVTLLQSLLSPRSILARNDAGVRALEGLSRDVVQLAGETPELVPYHEGALVLDASLRAGQKTGAFLDQFENRLLAGTLARGRVLDMFCYTGGFALASAPKADHVIAVDSSAAALELARANARRNDLRNVEFVEANAFDFLKQADRERRDFDLIVLDPPAFAKNKRELEPALRGYKEINLRAMKMLRPGGILITCSCSYHLSEPVMDEMLARAAADAHRNFRVRERRRQAQDHPVRTGFPEGSYLKCQVLERLD
jgi:23S rRNA (cytosine1962-C5)-methyltransferase